MYKMYHLLRFPAHLGHHRALSRVPCAMQQIPIGVCSIHSTVCMCVRWVHWHIHLTCILKKMGIPDHLTCLLRNLYAGQETAVRIRHETMDWSQIGKGVRQGCILSPCLFNFYAEYIMWNAGLDKAQAGVKISRININNLRYADDTTLMAESEEELKNLLK